MQPALEFRIGISGAFPGTMPTSPVEPWWQLSFRPGGIFLPKAAEEIAGRMRDIDRWEAPYVLLVQSQEPPAGREIIIHNVENFPVDTRRQPGEDNGFSAIVDVRERNLVRAAQMQENSKCPDSNPLGNVVFSGAIN